MSPYYATNTEEKAKKTKQNKNQAMIISTLKINLVFLTPEGLPTNLEPQTDLAKPRNETDCSAPSVLSLSSDLNHQKATRTCHRNSNNCAGHSGSRPQPKPTYFTEFSMETTPPFPPVLAQTLLQVLLSNSTKT